MNKQNNRRRIVLRGPFVVQERFVLWSLVLQGPIDLLFYC